ncbi:hypothetical protein [Algisphaera agarilytica]|nr:hypothetical protein [Algisphaera agarilytica]
MQTSDAALSLTENEAGPVLQMTLGQTERWPGVTFTLDHGADVSTHGELVFQIKNTGESSAKIHCRIDSQPAGSEASETLTRTHPISLKPGVMREVRIPLVPYVHYEGISPEDFFGMRGIPFFSNESMHLENITQLIFFVIQDNTPHSFELGPIRLAGEPAPPSTTAVPEQVFPFIDQFGQFKHKDWPGKTHSLEAMIQAGVDEAAQLAEAAPPSSWNRYGGWKDGPQLEATGWFRTAKHDGKWTLVDPEGRLFFSVGIDGVAFKLGTIVDERQHWFDHLPEDNAENSELYFSWTPNLKRSHFYNKSVRAFSFHKFNAMRKYGDDWENRFAEMCTQRLPAWGVNTLGNWSSPDIYLRGKLPYVAYVRPDSKPLAGSSGHWGKFKDVLDPSFEASIRRKLSEPRLVETIEDPMCIGYFVDNELTFGDETAMAVAALQSPVDQSAKWVFLSDLKQKYGTIDALNTAWQTNYASWAAMLEATHAPEGDGAHADLVAFNTKFVRTYFSTIHRVLEEVAPNHMYLGCRYGSNAQITPVVLEANAEFADVVSFNVYSRHLADKLAGLERTGDKPYIIGEFHFGALDRGMFDTGLVKVADQDERADAYYQYVMDCVNHPNIVGCHWFQFCDSPTTGRLWDHENYQIGFTDTCDTPYAELIEASRRAGEDLYE